MKKTTPSSKGEDTKKAVEQTSGKQGGQGAQGAKPAATKPAATKPAEAKPAAAKKVKATAESVAKKAKQVAERTAERTAESAARVGKAARDLSEGIEKVENDIASAAKRAKQKVREELAPAAETAKKVREDLKPAAEKVKQVADDLKPAAEKAGKGISAVFRATARATRKSARILGIKASIAAALRKRQKLFAQLGETYFHAQKKKTQSKSDQEALKNLAAAIDTVNGEISSLEAEEKLARESS
jgi:hypothetical protein